VEIRTPTTNESHIKRKKECGSKKNTKKEKTAQGRGWKRIGEKEKISRQEKRESAANTNLGQRF